MKKEIREKVWAKYEGRCAYCGKVIKYKNMQVDHIIPKCSSALPKNIIEAFSNYNPSCRRCNHYKRSLSLNEFRLHWLGELHKRIVKQYTIKVALDYGIVQIKPFDGKFYFEKIKNKLDKISN